LAPGGKNPWTLKARWVFPVEGPPLDGGAVTVAGDRVVAVAGTETPDVDLGDVAVLPGLVNAHTHLDLSGLRGRLRPGGDFTAWLRAVICHRRTLSPEQAGTDVRAGLAECLATGTTLVGDISGAGLSGPELAGAPVWAVVFYELLGLPRPRARAAWQAARAWLAARPAATTLRPGLSPHAPYSVRKSLFRATAVRARRDGTPVAIHLAETTAERQLLEGRRGPFLAFLTELGVWDSVGLVSGYESVLRTYARTPNTLFIHGNYLDAAAVPPGATVVYCPRTHAAFSHAEHPFRRLLAAGIRVALGTDSLGSNPDLDMLAEVRFLHDRFPEVDGAALLRTATLAGAEALGFGETTGSLVPGKSADLVVVPIEPRRAADPHDLLWHSRAPVREVLWRGRWSSFRLQ
jgi:cytosine/adenosine deaminase-related metal-dependent hydrolase